MSSNWFNQERLKVATKSETQQNASDKIILQHHCGRTE